MTKSDFIHILSDAMQLKEGWSTTEGAAFPNLNPGNLVFAHQPNATANGRWAKFTTFQNGKQAQLNQLALDLTRFDTIHDLITSYAPPSENNTAAYIADVIQFFAWRNVTITATESISAFIANFTKPVALIVVNDLSNPDDWHSVQQSISQLAGYMPHIAFSIRSAATDLTGDIVPVTQSYPAGTYSGISPVAAREVIAPYNQGHVLNVLIYDGTIMQGHPEPFGGCEYQGYTEPAAPISALASVMYQGQAFSDSTARTLFHELIHELFALTGQNDVLHAFLLNHGGYAADLATDLETVYNGDDLNTAQAIQNLILKEKKVDNQL